MKTIKTLLRIILSLLLVIAFLVLCFAIIMVSMFAIWMKSYQAFTAKKLVAEITVEKIAPENNLGRMRVTYKQKPIPNALETFLSAKSDQSGDTTEVQYELYGDQVLVGGPVVKFENIPTILGFDTLYKVSRIQGSFINTDKANSIPAGNVKDVNGGIDDTWTYFEADSEKIPWLIDTAYFSFAGKSVQSQPVTFGLFITEDGFILDRE